MKDFENDLIYYPNPDPVKGLEIFFRNPCM